MHQHIPVFIGWHGDIALQDENRPTEWWIWICCETAHIQIHWTPLHLNGDRLGNKEIFQIPVNMTVLHTGTRGTLEVSISWKYYVHHWHSANLFPAWLADAWWRICIVILAIRWISWKSYGCVVVANNLAPPRRWVGALFADNIQQEMSLQTRFAMLRFALLWGTMQKNAVKSFYY